MFVEQIGESNEHLAFFGGIILEDREAGFQFGLGLAEAVQFDQQVGAVQPIAGDVLRRALQRSLDLQDGIRAAQRGFPVLLGKVGLPGDV